jgi:hypothetical protein
MSQANNDLNNSELQKREQLETSSDDQRQTLLSKTPKEELAEWNRSPAELYGCLCHKPERADSVGSDSR